MELEEKVLEFSTIKKASFDGKSYLIRLPAELVRILEERKIPVENILLEGIWNLKNNTLCVLMIFGEKPENEKKPANEKEDEDYVVLRD